MEQILEDLACDPESAVSISFVDSDEMTELNRVYRSKDGPTNVLSFSQREGEAVGRNETLLGDVVICGERVRSDAEDLGYTIDEMTLYVLIHGILHLEGYDHQDKSAAEDMSARVEEIFHRYFP